MKKMKKLLSLVLTVAMVVVMGITTFAASDYKITVTNTNPNISINGKTYTAYKIFSASYSTSDPNAIVYSKDNTCLDVTYEGKTGDALVTWLATEEGTSNVRAFADYVYTNYIKGKNVTGVQATANGETAEIDLNAPGYYLVYGDATATNGKADASNVAVAVSLTTAKPSATINPKADAPSLKKEIKHNENSKWGVVGDNQIGDTVEFRTITTVPDTTGYTTYTYKIHDTMSAGLTSNVKSKDNIQIKIDDDKALDGKYYSVEATGNTFTVTVDIMKAVKDKILTTTNKLYTYYTGVLNSDAKIYDEGNQVNTAYLEYSNSPYDNGTGRTPDKKVYDWTFKMGVNKVDSTGNSLSGAKFVLSKENGLKIDANKDGVPTNNKDKLIKLIANEDGTYTVAPSNYDGVTTYVITAGNVTIKGLDDTVDYYLYETAAPSGYNKLTDPVHFKITVDTKNYGTTGETKPTPTVTVGTSAASEELSTNVVNTSGSLLPSTGGIGTTIFYVIGGILMVGAGVILVSRRRRSK